MADGTFTEDEHDGWFRREVERGLTEADDPATTWVTHDDVRSSWQRQRETFEHRSTDRTA